MIKISKINMSVNDQSNTLGDSLLNFKISGSNIDYIIVNTLRRTIFSDIPIYAFSVFNFEKNTSIFHNNYLKLRLQHMPIWSIKNTVDFIETTKVINPNMEKIDDAARKIQSLYHRLRFKKELKDMRQKLKALPYPVRRSYVKMQELKLQTF